MSNKCEGCNAPRRISRGRCFYCGTPFDFRPKKVEKGDLLLLDALEMQYSTPDGGTAYPMASASTAAYPPGSYGARIGELQARWMVSRCE